MLHNFIAELHDSHIYFTFNKLALIATTTVLTVINTAPAAGLSNMPQLYHTPAAKGNAITCYPVAQTRFLITLR